MTTRRWRTDSAGQRRPICEATIGYVEAWRRHEDHRCQHYAARELPDGRLVCAIHDPDRREEKHERRAVERRPPCILCRGTCALEGEDGRPFPCVCTPGGRELANGVPDSVVLRRLVDAGLLDP